MVEYFIENAHKHMYSSYFQESYNKV